jgi:D-glycero-D-manno-heptose 1,7-bisphosphate phosphatase
MLSQALIFTEGFEAPPAGPFVEAPQGLPPEEGGPLFDHLAWNLGRHGITDLVLVGGRSAARIREQCGDGPRFGLRLTFLDQAAAPGLEAGLRLAAARLAPVFLVCDGRRLFDINYLDLAVHRARRDALAALALPGSNRAPGPGGAILEEGRIIGFAAAGGSGPDRLPGGLAVMSREVLERLPVGNGPWERDLLAVLAAEGRLAGRVYDGFFCDIARSGTSKGADQALGLWRRKPAVFLDRDGVLNRDSGYVGSPERWDWVDGAPEAVKRCNDLGYLVLVVTNQSGIGRGYFDEARFWRLMAWANEALRERGAHIDAVYCCPHHPTAGLGEYRRDCACRKPRPGLIDQALGEWQVDIGRSVLVGDSGHDLEAAAARNIAGRLFTGGNLFDFLAFLPPIR